MVSKTRTQSLSAPICRNPSRRPSRRSWRAWSGRSAPRGDSRGRAMISVCVPATSANLGPGYDAVGLALSLSMRISLDRAPSPIVEVYGAGAELIPHGPDHPAYRAASFVAELVGEYDAHFHLVQQNDIPPARGLGGSAAGPVGGGGAPH